ncbi:MAG: hypothetical protein AUH10_03715 [Gammaproteobacteria bacterium 13_2_20CM_66_19]|nr:MAG: hypothetical protein AUH10_03715 [Gammaproteobacteria bacterium 13_2_20CM_66_19]
MKLTEYLELLAYDIGFWMSAFQSADYPLEQLGDVTDSVTAKLRAAAIIALLAKGDSDTYYHNLIRSGRCRLTYLQRCRGAGHTTDHHQASSRLGGFADAVAAADFATARQIVGLSPGTWLQGQEYEDDFCHAQILYGLIAAQPDPAHMQALFDRFATALDGRPDARLEVGKAIFGRSQADFDAAIEALLAQRTAFIEADKARHKIEEPVMIAERQVYVEGLAFLRIAERLGTTLQAEYLYLPSLARVPMRKPFPGE